MKRRCEACSTPAAGRKARPRTFGRLRRVLVGQRIVALCEDHAERFRESGKKTLEALRALFPEPIGKRSLVPRRSPLDRRIFPARPEGRRRTSGRRASDTP